MTSLRFVGCRVKLKTLDVVFLQVGCALLFAERQASSHGGLRPPASGSFDSHCLRKSPIHATHPQKVRNLVGGELVESKSKDWIDVINPLVCR